ncbi:sulfatase-like hydrolase/transferase [Haloarcula litorea]
MRFLDREIARFFSGLETSGQYGDALVIVVSDHGEGFGQKGVQSHQ